MACNSKISWKNSTKRLTKLITTLQVLTLVQIITTTATMQWIMQTYTILITLCNNSSKITILTTTTTLPILTSTILEFRLVNLLQSSRTFLRTHFRTRQPPLPTLLSSINNHQAKSELPKSSPRPMLQPTQPSIATQAESSIITLMWKTPRLNSNRS